MAKSMSFNQWIKALTDTTSKYAELGVHWVVGRGRLTRTSVEARALSYGMPEGAGASAWDAWVTYLGTTRSS